MELDTGAKEVLDHYYPSTLESVDLAETDILHAAGQAGFDEDEQHRIGMAVRECMVNSCRPWQPLQPEQSRSTSAVSVASSGRPFRNSNHGSG